MHSTHGRWLWWTALTAAALTAGVPAAALAGKDRPWSEIGVDVDVDEKQGEYSVIMIAIDGSRDIDGGPSYDLEPGKHSLRLASRKRGRSGEMTSLPYEIELMPCMRYEFVADHSQQTEGRSWRVVLKGEAPIKSCQRKYGEKLASAQADAGASDAGASAATAKP